MNYWFIRSPYKTRIWDDILLQGVLKLYGIRNHQSRHNIALMQRGDNVLFYKGGKEKIIVGVMIVSKEAYPDSTSSDAKWLAIDLAPTETFEKPITLKDKKIFQNIKDENFYKQTRVTVSKLSERVFNIIVEYSKTNHVLLP